MLLLESQLCPLFSSILQDMILLCTRDSFFRCLIIYFWALKLLLTRNIYRTLLLTFYSVEIWPYRLCLRGLMVTWIFCIVAVIFNTFVNPIAIDGIGWKYYIVYIALLVAWLVITFFWYPGT
jgi:hypothetical protein